MDISPIEIIESQYQKECYDVFKSKYGIGVFYNDEAVAISNDVIAYLQSVFYELMLPIKSIDFFKQTVLEMNSLFYKTALEDLEYGHLDKLKKHDFALTRRALKLIIGESCKSDISTAIRMKEEVVEITIYRLISVIGLIYKFADVILKNYAYDQQISSVEITDTTINPVFADIGYEQIVNKIRELPSSMYSKQTLPTADGQVQNASSLLECFGSDCISIFGSLDKSEAIYDVTETYESLKEAEFADGFILKADNIPEIKRLINKPKDRNRCFYKPILRWTVDGNVLLVTTPSLLREAIAETFNNSLVYHNYPEEWAKNYNFSQWLKDRNNNPQHWLEDATGTYFDDRDFIYLRNTKSINSISLEKDECLNNNIGEIDFILIHKESKTIFVIDCKNMQRNTDIASWSSDTDKFVKRSNPTKGYNYKLTKKTDWISSHIPNLICEFQIQRKQVPCDLQNYLVRSLFIIDTPTAYQYNSPIPLVRLVELGDFLTKGYQEPLVIMIEEKRYKLNYPLFANLRDKKYELME